MAFLKSIFDTREILDDRLLMLFYINLANHIKFFSVILKSDVDPECILLNINPFQSEKFQPEPSHYECFL